MNAGVRRSSSFPSVRASHMDFHWPVRMLGIFRHRARLMVAAILFGHACAAGGQLHLLASDKQPTAAASKPNIVAEQTQAEALFAEVQRKRESFRESMAAVESLSPELRSFSGEQFLLFDHLLSLLVEKRKRLDDIASRQHAEIPSLAANPLVRQIGDTPPYSALHVDALRDELDGLRNKFLALKASQSALAADKQIKQQKLQQAGESARLAADKLQQARGEPDIERARRAQETASLRLQVAETNLSISDIEQDLLRLQAEGLKRQADAMQEFVKSIQGAQRLAVEDLAEQKQRLEVHQAQLAAELDRVGDDSQKRIAEYKHLLKRPDAASEKSFEQRRAMLERAMEIDAALLQGLRGLKMLSEVIADAWERRYLALSAEDPEQRRLAQEGLGKLHSGLVGRKRLSSEMRDMTRVALREQENRIANLPRDSKEMAEELEILSLMARRADVDERVELAAERFEKQLARWLSDFTSSHGQSIAQQATTVGKVAKSWFGKLWNYELFSVEDISDIDGRRVTVSYGVTVGKSIGALLLFAVGYWVFAMLVQQMQNILVRRFGIDLQVARVIRRWVMIVLALMLVIFVLNLARIPLTVFAFLGGALAIGVGFGTQTIIKNFISGIIILFERKIRVGDIIDLGGMTGQVTAVDLRATTVRGFDGVEALVPNSNFLEQQVVNWTYSNQQIRREIRVGVAYGADVRGAEAVLLRVAHAHSNVLGEPAPEVFFEDFADSALLLVLVYWVELGPGRMARRIDSELRHEIYLGLAAAAIAIAFPQRDLHLDTPRPLKVEMVAAAPNDQPGTR